MTKFLQYITEGEGRTLSIGEERAMDLINKHCSKNYKLLSTDKIGIYRGIKDISSDYAYIDSNKGKLRTSANTENYMTLLMDNLPSWKNYPKRSRGIICSTSTNVSGYGTVYKVFPYDNAKIGICPSFDVWESFHKTSNGYSVPDFNEMFKSTFYRYGINVDDSNWNSFKSGLNKLDLNTILKDHDYYHTYLKELCKYLFNTDKNIIKHLDNILNPNFNKFNLGINNLKYDKEIWIQGEAIFIIL